MRVNLLLFFLFFLFIYCCGASRFVIGNLEASHFAPRHKLHSPIAQQVLRPQNTENIYTTTEAVVSPIDFGADPHGKEDSTKAFLAAIKTLLTQYGSNHTLAENIIDVGGAVLDLQGGDYLVSLPLSFPPLYGNFLIQRGTIRASSNFPTDRYLIEVGSNSVGDIGNENIGFENLMLDCQHYALGGLLLNKTMGINVGPRIFVLGFTKFGITVNGGHEVVIHEAWLGQYLFSDPRYHNITYLNGTGIAINGNDHFITNTIVFSSLVGVSVSGEANLLTGVHTWNLMEGEGGTGILVDTPPGYTQNRLVACYLDYNDIVAIDPEHLTIVDGFFLCGGNIILRAETNGHIIEGLVISDNQFDGCDGGPSIVVDQSIASFSGVYDTKIDGNMYNGYKIEGTRATLQVHNTSSIFVFNFTNVLLFSTIQNVQYSIQINEPSTFVQHASRPPNGLIVFVETSQEVDATITMTVDQSLPSQPF